MTNTFNLELPSEFQYTERMKNEDYQMTLNGYNARLAHFDAKKRVIDEMIKDLGRQYNEASEEWSVLWRERQSYINDHEK